MNVIESWAERSVAGAGIWVFEIGKRKSRATIIDIEHHYEKNSAEIQSRNYSPDFIRNSLIYQMGSINGNREGRKQFKDEIKKYMEARW